MKLRVGNEKRKKSDPVVSEIERALDLGQFISYNRSWDFVRELEDSKKRIDALVKNGEAERAVGLYEMFLSGCYEKAEEIDDSGGNLGIFFGQLFCAWIKARQKAGCKADETVQYVLKWMDNDDYGFCYDIEQDIAQVLNKAGFWLFMKHFQRARKLYKKVDHEQMWVSLVDRVRKNHSRKYSFIGDFEKIVAGRWPDSPETFEKRVRKRWVKQTSD